MKKIAIASLIAMAAMSASALEVGVTAAREYTGTNTDGMGITLGQKFGKVGPVTVTPKVGVAHLRNSAAVDGYALTLGVGASVPLNKTVDLTVDARRQYGQDRVNAFDGNTVTAGLKVKF
jgi:opacity protein-like surface antigen